MNGIGTVFTFSCVNGGRVYDFGTTDITTTDITTTGGSFYEYQHGEITDNMIYNLWIGNGIEITARFFDLTKDAVADVILERFDKDIKLKGVIK